MTVFDGMTVDEFMEALGFKRIYVTKLVDNQIMSFADMSEEDKDKLRQAQQDRYKLLYDSKIVDSKIVDKKKLVETMDPRMADDGRCLHDKCPECSGSGRKQNGQTCVHMLSCKCSKCSPGSL